MPNNYRFPNPFSRNHCVVLALTHLREPENPALFAISLAAAAYRQGRLSSCGLSAQTIANFAWWAGASGLRYGKKISWRPGWRSVQDDGGEITTAKIQSRITLARFARENATGRWFVRVQGHAVAVIDGEILGFYQPRSIVTDAIKVQRTGS